MEPASKGLPKDILLEKLELIPKYYQQYLKQNPGRKISRSQFQTFSISPVDVWLFGKL
jgi:hypothetical protein